MRLVSIFIGAIKCEPTNYRAWFHETKPYEVCHHFVFKSPIHVEKFAPQRPCQEFCLDYVSDVKIIAQDHRTTYEHPCLSESNYSWPESMSVINIFVMFFFTEKLNQVFVFQPRAGNRSSTKVHIRSELKNGWNLSHGKRLFSCFQIWFRLIFFTLLNCVPVLDAASEGRHSTVTKHHCHRQIKSIYSEVKYLLVNLDDCE